MKKTILALIFAVMSIGIQAQTHLKFQGIPIDGTFAQFEAKLKAKGWVYDYEKSKKYPADDRFYKGTFSGLEGELAVSRTPISKKVFSVIFWGAKVYEINSAKQQCQWHLEALRRVYPDAAEVEIDKHKTQFELDDGLILCGILEDGYGGGASYIHYIDFTNQQKFLSESDSDY